MDSAVAEASYPTAAQSGFLFFVSFSLFEFSVPVPSSCFNARAEFTYPTISKAAYIRLPFLHVVLAIACWAKLKGQQRLVTNEHSRRRRTSPGPT